MTTTLTLVPTVLGAEVGYSTDTNPEPTYVDDNLIFQTLVECSGSTNLVLEKFKYHYQNPITKVDLLRAVKDRLPELKEYMEAIAALELFSLMPTATKVLQENMNNVEAADAINMFMGLHKLISLKVDTTKVDVTQRHELAWGMIPPDLRQLWTQIEAEEAS